MSSFYDYSSSSSNFEEEEKDGWAIAPEVEKDTKELDYSGQMLTFLPPDLFSNFALTVLNLANNKITWLPKEMEQLAVLEELYLQNNELNRIGSSLEFTLPNLKVLRLSHNQLMYCPQKIGMLTKLRLLDLSNNAITEIPMSIQYLTSLETFNIENNNLTTIRPEIYHLENLKELCAYNNKISNLNGVVFPPRLERLDLGKNELTYISTFQFAYLENLQYLQLSNNRICFVEEDVFLKHLHTLTELHLASNDLQQLPYSIGTLVNLKLLNLSGNQLNIIPDSIGFLTSLLSLYLNSNRLCSLPRSIGNLKSLEYLDLSYNLLTFLPPTIGTLDNLLQLKLMYNDLIQLPRMICSLTNLSVLNVTGNENIQSPPLDVCQNGIEKIFEYLNSLPCSIEDMEEGWEIVNPTERDIDIEFGLNASTIAPYLIDSFEENTRKQENLSDDEPIENPQDGWISYTMKLLSRSIFGE